MKVPFVCEDCEREVFAETDTLTKKCICGGKMTIDYRDNYEQVAEPHICDTCVHNRSGNGEKCNYCTHI